MGIINEYERRRNKTATASCHSEAIDKNTIYKLSDIIKRTLKLLNDNEITLYLENNSRLDPIFSTSKEMEIVFNNNPNLEFLLDIAHINCYEQMKEMILIKRPKILHIADKRFNIIHEHLPIGYGEINFEYIFDQILCNYDGKIILEIVKKTLT